jgi:hypothetical protein
MWHGTSCYRYCMKAEVKILVGYSTIQEWRYFPGMQWQCIVLQPKCLALEPLYAYVFNFLTYFLQEMYCVRVGLMEVTFGIFQCGSDAWDCFTNLSLIKTHTHTHTESWRDHAHCAEKLVTSVKSAAEQPVFLYKISWYSNSMWTFCHI